jgi:hypothetical protein
LDELIVGGLVERVTDASKLKPQYRLPEVSLEEEPIFLPMQLVTGFKGETPVLRRVRESGDALVLRMLIDLYGLVQTDATFGVPIDSLKQGVKEGASAKKITEMGVHALWAVELDHALQCKGVWCATHYEKKRKGQEWVSFWERIKLLRDIGALWFEPWLFESSADDAEPMFPVDFGVLYSGGVGDQTTELSWLLLQVARSMSEGREYLLENTASDLFVALPIHHQTPVLRGVAKLMVEPDTPGCRIAYARRSAAIADRKAAYERLLDDVTSGRYDRPLGAVV